MTKHTKGPWINNGGRIETEKHRPLAVVGEVNNQSFEDTANARLMVASPDLLEAAKATSEAYGCECLDDSKHCPMCMLRAAIAKAEGVTNV